MIRLELAASSTPTNVNNCLHYNLVLFGAFAAKRLAVPANLVALGVDFRAKRGDLAVYTHVSRLDLLFGGTARKHAAIGKIFLKSDLFHKSPLWRYPSPFIPSREKP